MHWKVLFLKILFWRFISSPELKAHWWAYRIGRLRRPSSVRPSSTLFKYLLLRNHWVDWSQISYGVSMGWGNESLFKRSWSHDQDGHHAQIFFSGTKRLMTLTLGMQHLVLEYYQICSNDDAGLILTYFTARSNLVPYAFVWEKGKTMDFSETMIWN